MSLLLRMGRPSGDLNDLKVIHPQSSLQMGIFQTKKSRVVSVHMDQNV